jgi:hypothetical protein
MVYENEQIGGGAQPQQPGIEQPGMAGDNGQQRARRAQEWARSRGTQASGWARSQLSQLQGRVESDPQRATIWALGAGLVAGVVLSSLLRGGNRQPRIGNRETRPW